MSLAAVVLLDATTPCHHVNLGFHWSPVRAAPVDRFDLVPSRPHHVAHLRRRRVFRR